MIPHIEKQTTAEIKAFQELKLQEVLQYVSANSVYYQNLFQEHNIDISKINTLEDLQQIPTTTKEDLQRNNDDFLCVPTNKIIDFAKINLNEKIYI